MERARQPKGTSKGGQFAPDANPESTVALEIPVTSLKRGSPVVVYGEEIKTGTVLTVFQNTVTVNMGDGTTFTYSKLIVADREDFDRAWHVVNDGGEIIAGGPNLSKQRVEALAEQKGGIVRRGRDIKIVPFTILDEQPGYKSQAARDAQASNYGDKSYWDYLDAAEIELSSKVGYEDALTRSLSDALRGNEGI